MEKRNLRPVLGFTLVELIVVITILAILGTIAIMAFGGYSKNARDSARTSDLNNITKTLELFKLKAGFYPEPSTPFNVTYSGAIAWTQGSFGDSTTQNVEKLDKKPTDPLTGSDYTYSVTNTKAEFEVAAIYEGDNLSASVLPQTYAAETLQSIVKGTYNGKIVKTSTGTTTYILGAPSIITSEITSVDIQTILTNKSFVYNNYKNLPSSYQGTAYSMTGGFDFSGGTGVVLFEGDMTTLGTSTGKLAFANKLDTYYSVPPLDSNKNYKEIIDLDTVNNSNGAIILINSYLENEVAGIIAEQSDLLEEGDLPIEATYAILNCPTINASQNLTTPTKGEILSNINDYIGCDIAGFVGEITGFSYSGSVSSENKMILLIASSEEGLAQWGTMNSDISTLNNITSLTGSTTSIELWDGLNNSQAIKNKLTELGESNRAVQKCDSRVDGGQIWYIPAIEELNQMYCYSAGPSDTEYGSGTFGGVSAFADCVNKGYPYSHIGILSNVLNNYYRSSTEYASNRVWSQRMYWGFRDTRFKSNTSTVAHCVSRF